MMRRKRSGQPLSKLPNVIFWIDKIRFRNDHLDQISGRVKLDRSDTWSYSEEELRERIILEGCVSHVRFSWFSFAQDAINIYGGIETWESRCQYESDDEYVEEGDLDWTTIKVPRAQFGYFGHDSNIRLIASISGFALTNNHFGCLQRSCTVCVLPSEFLEDDHVGFSVSVECCHESCFEWVEYDWVAVTERFHATNPKKDD